MLRLLLLPLAGLLVFVPPRAEAQQNPREEGENLNLPGWALSRVSPPGQKVPAPPGGPAPALPEAPEPPEDPAPVPLGGLEWLALAGGAYAVRRLRRRRRKDAAEDDARL